jgi:hypothetical protein
VFTIVITTFYGFSVHNCPALVLLGCPDAESSSPGQYTMNDTLETSLEPDERELWATYQHLLESGLRNKAQSVLDEFIRRLEAYPSQKRQKWVFDLCQAVLDQGQPYPIQYPLLIRIVLPVLRVGYEQKKPPYARWIAQLIDSNYSWWSRILETLGLAELYPEDFLREAISIDSTDSTDSLARQHLIKVLARRLDFYIHEAPWGILAEPSVFQTELDELVHLVSIEGLEKQYDNAVRNWRFHCHAWADYLSRRRAFVNYADYLSRRAADEAHYS